MGRRSRPLLRCPSRRWGRPPVRLADVRWARQPVTRVVAGRALDVWKAATTSSTPDAASTPRGGAFTRAASASMHAPGTVTVLQPRQVDHQRPVEVGRHRGEDRLQARHGSAGQPAAQLENRGPRGGAIAR